MNKRHIFLSTRNYQLSYALKWAIESYYNAEVYFYAQSKNDTHPPVYEIANEIKIADLFIQILDYDNESPLGSTSVEEQDYLNGISSKGLPVLEWEYLYFTKNRKANSVCKVVRLGGDSNKDIEEYLKRNGGIEKFPAFIQGNYGEILEKIVGSVANIGLLNSNPHSANLINGHIDKNLDTTKILEKLRIAIKKDQDIFEQKYLYSTLIGAFYWKELVGNDSNHAYNVYSQFPFRLGIKGDVNLKLELTNFLDDNILKSDSINSYQDYKKYVFYIVGCGSGNREAELVKWLEDHYNVKEIEIVLIDIASELINISINNFKQKEIHNLHFAILDIEANIKKTLKSLRDLYTKKDAVACFIFLGNTLANIDEDVFLDEFVEIMDFNDILFAEFLCEENRNKLLSIKNDREIVNAGHIEKFKFTTNVLKLIDIVPRPNNFFMEFIMMGAEGRGSALRREYYYLLKSPDKYCKVNGKYYRLQKEYIKPNPTQEKYIEDKTKNYANKSFNSNGTINTSESWNITKDSRIKLLKIDTFDEEFTNLLFTDKFGKGNYLIQTKEYTISSDLAETTRMAYITAIKK